MSGRMGYRKTDRTRSARTLLERLDGLNDRCARRFPSRWVPDVRLGFLLPRTLAPFVRSGPHGIGVRVLRGFVQISHGSATECYVSAAEFFAAVARGRPAFRVMSCVKALQHPDRCYGRWLVVVNGAMVVAGGVIEPQVYEHAA